jgi:hypothetical protein
MMMEGVMPNRGLPMVEWLMEALCSALRKKAAYGRL